MFIHLEMRKTMSQEPFDFSSTAESDFAPSHAYVSKKTKKEDVTSTAYTFTIVSVAGFILLILFGLDLLPFHSASYTKTLILIVMGVMFAIFFFIGIKSFMELKTLSNAADREEKKFEVEKMRREQMYLLSKHYLLEERPKDGNKNGESTL